LRGLAVLIMIEAHLLDSWTGGPDRQTAAFALARLAGGIGGPLFLFLAGVSVSLAAAARLRRSGDPRAASRAVVRRGGEIFALAFLFRAQAAILGWSSPRDLLKVDILNIMGPSIAAAAACWGASKSTRGRLVALAFAAAAVPLLTPLVRAAPIGGWPDPIEAYLRPTGDLSNFVFFPSAGFVFAGAVAGILIDAAPAARESRLNLWLFLAGLGVSIAAWGASYFPSPYPVSDFWTSSPCYFFVLAGLTTAAIGAAYAWQSRPGGDAKWSPLRQLGRTSLFVYWIHVEMVYGLISLPLHKALTLTQSLIALAGFSLFMLACSIAKDRAVAWWRRTDSLPAASRPSSGGVGSF
jgi:uncharacterized membrane protein